MSYQPQSTLIFGGSGKVARHITRLLTSPPHDHAVYNLIRNPSQTPSIASLGGNPVVQNIETATVQDLTATITTTNATTIIWSAGAGGGDPARTRAVDHEGAVKAMDAAAAAAVGVEGGRRFVMVSAVDVRDRDSRPEPEWYSDFDRTHSERVWSAIGSYMEAKLAADRELVGGNGKRGLRFTIVRPGGLSEEASTGKVSAGKVHISPTIPREDVAKLSLIHI